MKYFNILIFWALINFGSSAFATTPIVINDDTRIETVNEHVFFILKVDNGIINYGDKVELIFGINYKIELYNISGNDIHTFRNLDELVLLIAPEDLRCFKNKTLRKVKIYTQTGKVSIKTNIGPGHIKIK